MKKIYTFLIIISAVAFTTLIFWTPKPPVQEKQIHSDPCFLLLSDVHLNTASKITLYGQDAGTDLWNNLKAKLTSILEGKNPPKFIIYTGDVPAHYHCKNDCYLAPGARMEHNKNLTTFLTEMRTLVSAHHVPFFYVPGNNDALGGDYYSFADSAHQTPLDLIPETTNPYPALNTSNTGTQPPYMIDNTHAKMGYYAVKPIPGLTVIALNSVIFGKKYFPIDGISQLDAGNEEMRWLGNKLSIASAKGDKVYLAMHIPPGKDAFNVATMSGNPFMWASLPNAQNSWLNQFLKLATIYNSTICGIFYGHTHEDEVRRLYDSTGTKIMSVAISCPGVSTSHFNNPGFKLVYYNSSTFQPTDFETFYTSPKATTWGNDSYSFSSVFHCKKNDNIFQCLSSQSLHDVNNEMDSIYMVMHGRSLYNTESGVEVKMGE